MKTNIFKLKAVLVFLFIAFQSFNGISQKVYTLKNQNVEFSVDDKGNLTSLTNLETGQNYASDRPLWRLYYDSKDEKDIEILGKQNMPSIKLYENKVQLKYEGLKLGKEELNVELILTIEIDNDNKLHFGSEISNNEPHTIIRELQYPLVSNCQFPADHKLLTTWEGGQLYPDPITHILSQHYSYMGPDHKFRQIKIKYPGRVSSNCFALVGDQQGLYVGSHDTTFQSTWHGLRVYPDENRNFSELDLGLYKYPNCGNGETWTNYSNVISPYSGSWHKTSKIYREWVNTWWEHREEPMWVKEMKGFQRNIMKHQYGETLFTYNELNTRIKEAGKSVGIDVVFPFGWWDSGMDNGYPDSYFITDPKQGGDKQWKKEIADFKKDGGKVILYYNGKLVDTESAYFRKNKNKSTFFNSNTGVQRYEAYRFYGPGTFTGFYDARTFVVADTKDSSWLDMLIKMSDHAYELGANSVFYDQLGYVENMGMWDTSGEFPKPELQLIYDKANALKLIHDYIDSTKEKEFAIGTEHISDVTSQYCDYIHTVIFMNSPSFFLDWYRYTFPEIILSDRNIDGDETNVKWLVNKGLLLGLRNNVQIYRLRETIDKVPVYQKHLAAINKLKDKYSSLLLLGTYKDTEGFVLDKNSVIEGRSFVSGDNLAVVMTHKSEQTEFTQISVPGYEFQESSGVGDVKITSGTNTIPNVTIRKDGVAVLIYKKKH